MSDTVLPDNGNASDKFVLIFACNLFICDFAAVFLPSKIGFAEIETASDNNTFIKKLKERKYDIVMFELGPCRDCGANNPMSVGDSHTDR